MFFPIERFYPDSERHYGAVAVMNRGEYQLVCSDNFTDIEATTFCRTFGYQKGKSICCSAFDVPSLVRDNIFNSLNYVIGDSVVE